ncbi:MAG TPA: hypothetical protein VLB83_01065, partial [Candidatus Paceibacterota bacterium]|nr:hypothetical protein [Candidatus Paceibacterota bacterium]
RDLSRSSEVAFDKRANEAFLAAARAKIRETRTAFSAVALEVRKGSRATQAVEELLDNLFVIDGGITELLERWRRSDALRVPLARDDEGRMFPRAYLIAKAFIRETHCRIDRPSLELFLSTYQRLSPLSVRELDAFPDVLRYALIEEISLVVDATRRMFREVALAEEWFHRIGKASRKNDPATLSLQTAALAAHFQVIPAHFGFHLLQRITQSGKERNYRVITKWLKMTLARQGVGSARLPDAIAKAQRDHMETVRNAVASVRWLGQIRWERMSSGLNAVDAVLAKDPVAAYEQLDDFTRGTYRRAVIRIAERLGVHDVEIAKEVLRLARAHAPRETDRVASHVGYFLVDEGVEVLERSVGYRARPTEHARRWLLAHATAAYLGFIGVASLLAVFGAVRFHGAIPADSVWMGIFSLSLLVLVSEFATMIAHVLFTRFVPPRAIPSLDLSRGIGPDRRTVVAVPAMFKNADGNERLVRRLETNFLANRDPDIRYVLLLDLPDAKSGTLPSDSEMIADMMRRVDELNRTYAAPSPIFLCFFRTRAWNDAEGVFMGWERKRGKLREFNRLLRGARTSFTIDPTEAVALLGSVRYVITLDEDTELLRDSAHKLIGTIDHPLNRPVIDPATQIVRRGYGIVEPRSALRFSDRGATLFARLYGAYPGVEAYSSLTSDLHLDLFGDGLFHGKGIYDVDAVEATMEGRIPDGLVLSHDLLEGL